IKVHKKDPEPMKAINRALMAVGLMEGMSHGLPAEIGVRSVGSVSEMVGKWYGTVGCRDKLKKKMNKLADYDAIIDKGEGENNVVNGSTEVVKLLQEVEKKNSLEAAQKAKIKWAIEVSKEEIKKVVWDCVIDKSPGPDGFTFGFYHYRPISLIGSMYKTISKILANRLVVVLGGLVNEIQSAFVADKQIPDGSFILNELVQWCKKKKKQSFIFKVDFERRMTRCLRSSKGSVIVNGSPIEEFQFYKGLKQGDLLSPFLFILVMESLYTSFQRVVNVGLFKGIELAHFLNLSHMFYADDAIFMGQWSESNIDTIVKVLDCFNRASGLRINMTKSNLLGISVEDDKDGLHHMKSMRSHFFNGAELSSKKSVWVKWKHALASKDKGGLGVSILFARNRALMFKWAWHFITQGSSLWARVIKALHGYDGKIGQKGKSCYPLLWLDIIHEVKMFKSRGIDLVSLIHSKLGNGANTSFWEVAWRGGSPFKSLFTRLYALETQKKIDVSSKLFHSGLDVSFCRPPRVVSKYSSGEFTITSVRKMIDDFMLPEVSSKTRWIKAVPIKVNVHAWRVKLDGLPTRLNISRRGIDIESILSLMCEASDIVASSHASLAAFAGHEMKRVYELGAIDTGGGELSNGSASNDKWVSSSSTLAERAKVYCECMKPFKSLMCLWVRSRSMAAIWLEKVVTLLIDPAIKGFAAALAVLKPKHLKVDKIR
nr:RNA-directed DNA polymerase, eukaryota, reverse transcriptase zinc-binding domain protein [Tanacetum cinerariifolium]